MEQVIKFWEFFSGKKTAIAAILFAASDIAVALGHPDIADATKKIAYAFAGTGLGHKGVKAVRP